MMSHDRQYSMDAAWIEPSVDYIVNRSWAEIHLDRLAQNVRSITNLVQPQTEVMGIVKADAYGHGAVEVSKCMLENGYTRLAVSLLDEAIQLRQQGIKAPILILSYTDPRRVHELIEYQVTQTVYSWDLIHALEVEAKKLNVRPKVHIKIDTGMNRIGFKPSFASVESIERISELEQVQIEGLFTHFATADEADDEIVKKQFHLFHSIYTELERQGIYIPIKHCCNSAGILKYPEYHLNMVRAGLISYGILPENCAEYAGLLRPIMGLKSNIIEVKDIPVKTGVGYNHRFVSKRSTIVATIPIGYADGYARIMSGQARVLIHGESVPVIGNICMDACMLDVTDLKDPVKIGDEVVLMGEQGDVTLTVEDLADWQQTIPYEVTCIIGKRVPRVYVRDGEVASIMASI